VKGTVDFRYDFHHDLVVATPRWKLETPVEVMHWYQVHARYFGARFSRPKDMAVVEDAFEVASLVAPLWASYRDKLHESLVRHRVVVKANAPPRLTTTMGSGRYAVPSEARSVDEAIAAILALRAASEPGRPSGAARVSGAPAARIPTAPPSARVPTGYPDRNTKK